MFEELLPTTKKKKRGFFTLGNKYGFSVGNKCAKGGSKKKFKDPEQMIKAIEFYFKKCDNAQKEVVVGGNKTKISRPRPYTIEGLALSVGLTRKGLFNYCKQESHQEFHEILRKAKEIIIQNQIEGAFLGDFSPHFATFILKNTGDYSDKTEIEATIPLTVTVGTEEARKKITRDD